MGFFVQIPAEWVHRYPQAFDALSQHLSYPVEGAAFQQAYKMGKWDGRNHLIDKKGRLPAGLVPRAQDYLLANFPESIEALLPHLEDEESTLFEIDNYQHDEKLLRPYQFEAVKTFLAKRKGILEIGTGGGKTRVAVAILKELCSSSYPGLFIVPSEDLKRQVIATISELVSPTFCMELWKKKWTPSIPVSVSTASLLSHKKNKALLQELSLTTKVVVFDEAHHSAANTWYEVAETLDQADYRMGLTATPYRTDGSDILLEAATGPVVVSYPLRKLVELGYLVMPQIQMVATPFPGIRGYDWRQIYERGIVYNTYRNNTIVALVNWLIQENNHIILLVNELSHGNLFKDALGKDCEFLVGDQKVVTKTRRKEILEQFAAKKFPVLIATRLGNEGLDIPAADTLVNASGGKAESTSVQKAGRITRLYPGKRTANYYDFQDTHHPLLARHARERWNSYLAHGMPGRPVCMGLYQYDPNVCLDS